MRNTNKYTKLYSGGTPIFIEDNIFEIIIPMEKTAQIQVRPEETNKEIPNTIIDLLETEPETTINAIAGTLGMSVGGVRYHINKMKKAGLIEHSGPTKKGKWIIHKHNK